MPADDPFAFIAAEQGQRKPAKKSLWKDKLFNKDKNRSTPDQQIEAFLGSTRPNPDALPPSNLDPSGLPPPPNFTTAHRIPSAQDVSRVPPPPIVPPVNENYASFNFSDEPPPRKPRGRKGLRVGFSNQTPDVIGEGGDEAEAPTIEISRSRQRSRSRGALSPGNVALSQEPSPSRGNVPNLRVNTSLGDGEAKSQYKAYSKGQGDGANIPDWKPPLMHDPHDAEFLNTLSGSDSGSRLSFRGDSHSFAERVRDKMQAEEGLALQHRFDDEDIPDDDDDDSDYPSPELPPELPSSSPESIYETPPVSTAGAKAGAPSVKSVIQSIRHPSTPAVHRQLANFSPTDPRPPPHATAGSPPEIHTSPPPKVPTHEQPQIPQLSSRDNREPSRSPQPPKYTLKGAANQLGDVAFTEFKEYMSHYDSLLRLAAESVKPLMETSLAEWVRAAVWWFLRGKTRLETYARTRSNCPPSYAKQAVVDLGKALWINENILPTHYELARYGSMSMDALMAVVSTTGDQDMADLLSLHQTCISHLRSLSMSIKRNNILSIIMSDADSTHQLDTTVWLRYPFFAPDVSVVLSGSVSRSMLVDHSGKAPNMIHMMPMGDTNRFFSYGSMFVQVCISSTDDEGQQYAMPCALTIIRERSDWYVHAAITSQSQLVNIMIQSDRKQGPTWDDVDWQVRAHTMRVKLPRGFELDVMFKEDDFKTLWNIVKYTRKSEASLQPEPGESLVFESTLKVFHYMDPGTPKAFPSDPLERCRMRLFERSMRVTEGTGTRNVHQGFRLVVLTSPKVKTLSCVRHILGNGMPIVFGLLRGENGAPALLLKVTEDGRMRSMLMTFHEVEERTRMHSLLLGMSPRDGETKTSEILTRGYSIEQPGDKATGLPPVTYLKFPAGNVFVIDQQHGFVEHGYGPTILSEHLRAFVATEWGSVTDRINLGPGELKMSLDVSRKTSLSLFRPAQQDLTLSLADNLIRPELPDQLSAFLEKLTAKPMIRRFDFGSVKDLHAFEAAVTGFQVLYDGIACSFIISRRRSMVPIYKKWEANLTRVQIVQQENLTQMLAFFSDFQHGTCMNFVLKGTDLMESFSRSGKFGIRIVDCKFALPKTDPDPASDFVCLDMPEYPIEHDDITIAFDSETDRGRFIDALPGSVREASRMGSLRR
ncbi:hypothetical protein N7474_010361 [Penicillium riverlandense]|uniref:uncharacterized protein n=1 Tax=Penicillium riverlandense TaxID=1903569 RepID=UPI002546D86F|nr:uncharacterized protein N7474_010361 [Penicillium riverlandense]KAJ5806769.1 hypothetical protein N7474_010361 [Penicillium riverlandense]